MPSPTSCTAALKEWAIAIQALDQGRQVLILRKGGIREEGNRFRVLYPEFLLFPSYEHQQMDLLRPEHAEALTVDLTQQPEQEWLTFTHFAQVHRAFPVAELEELQALAPYHIWTESYAEQRLRWRPRQALTAMVLRVHRLESAVRMPLLPQYGGCTSWLELAEPALLGNMTPVLSADAFAAAAGAIDDAMAAVTSAPVG